VAILTVAGKDRETGGTDAFWLLERCGHSRSLLGGREAIPEHRERRIEVRLKSTFRAETRIAYLSAITTAAWCSWSSRILNIQLYG
jgi:hypothetical protein